MGKIRVAVVGVGYLGQFHAEKYAVLPNVELVGVVDQDQVRSRQIAGKFSARAFGSHAELLGKVDAVSIAVPTAFHFEVAKQFLEAGIHVLLEKPIAVTLEQADELVRLAGRSRAVLQVGHIERFNPAITSIKPHLKAPRYMQAERCAPFTVRCTDVNVVLDLMIHDLDIVTYIAASRPTLVSAAGASFITREIDSAVARIIFENGCTADVEASRVSDEKKRSLRVFDADALYTADYQTQKAVCARRGGGPVPELVAAELPAERRDTLLEEIRSFIDCIAAGKQPSVSGTDGRNALALARLISDCIERGTAGFVPFS